MIKFDIKNRWSGEVKFTAEIDCDADASYSLKVRLAVKWGIKSGADLTDADLTDVNLTDVNLTRVNLTRADLTRVNLTDADLTRADLTDADLTRANLTGADLTGADLTGADLTGADLTDADLTRADLTRADLTRVNLTDVNLTRVNLTRANLTRVNLTRANLTVFRDDLWAVLSSNPAEVEGLLTAIVEGRIDGSTYSGECACLSGTLENCAKKAHHDFDASLRNSSRPIERLFLMIRVGDTPENSQAAKLAVGWIDTWLRKVKSAFAK